MPYPPVLFCADTADLPDRLFVYVVYDGLILYIAKRCFAALALLCDNQ